MRTFAYCAASYADSARRASGVEPVTCPPVNAKTFDPRWPEGHRFVYFDLHGLEGKDYWFEMVKEPEPMRIVAMTAALLSKCYLDGAVVFAANCYLANKGSSMMTALFDAGARCVVGGDGENWAGNTWQLYGADLLGMWFRRWLRLGLSPTKALALAKEPVRRKLKRHTKKGKRKKALAAADTLAFRVYYKKQLVDKTFLY